MQNASNDEYTHTTVLWPFFWDYLGGPVPEEIFWTIRCKEDIRGRHTDSPAGATPSGLISDTPPSSPHFYGGYLSCRNPANLSSLGAGTKCAGLHTQWKENSQYMQFFFSRLSLPELHHVEPDLLKENI